MKQKSPLSGGLLLYALFQVFFVQNAFAQIGSNNSGVTLTVTAGGVPTDFFEGNCGYGTANFGGFPATDICAPPAWAHDSNGLDSLVCDSIPVGSLTGKIALVRRGGCAAPNTAAGNFVAKALNAQKAGATAVFIANNSANAAQNDCFTQNVTGVDPAVTVPVFFISRSLANFIDGAINSGQLTEICIHPPNVYIDSTFFPVQNIQTPVSQIGVDTFGFFAFLTNTRGTTLTNVVLKASVQTTAGVELYATTLDIPTLDGSVSDSLFVLPDVFPPELPVGDYQIVYSTDSDPLPGGGDYKQSTRDLFHVTENLFAKDDGPTIGLQPAPIPATGWGVGNLYVMKEGTQDHYKVTSVQTSNNGVAAFPANKMNGELFLFRVTDEVAADYANFEDADFFSPSFELKGTGSYVAPSNATAYQIQTSTLLDLDSAEPGVPLENGSHYVLAIFYSDSSRLGFNGFDEDVEVAGPQGIGTLSYSDKWYLGGFAGGGGAILRMFIDLVVTTDEKPLPDAYMKIFPNPVKDVLNLGLGFDKPTDVTVTIAEMSGRTIRIEDKSGLTNEILTYQLSQLPSGTYLARIATKEGTLTKKFVVQK